MAKNKLDLTGLDNLVALTEGSKAASNGQPLDLPIEDVIEERRVIACRDPKDDQFLHVALNGNAEIIVTGDADLLALQPFHNVNIVDPKIFLEMT